MPPLLLIAITLVVAGLIGIFLLRRHAAARAARIRAANDAKELYEAAVVLRLRAAASGRLARPGDPDAGDSDADDAAPDAAIASAADAVSAEAVPSTETVPTVAIVATNVARSGVSPGRAR